MHATYHSEEPSRSDQSWWRVESQHSAEYCSKTCSLEEKNSKYEPQKLEYQNLPTELANILNQ